MDGTTISFVLFALYEIGFVEWLTCHGPSLRGLIFSLRIAR